MSMRSGMRSPGACTRSTGVRLSYVMRSLYMTAQEKRYVLRTEKRATARKSATAAALPVNGRCLSMPFVPDGISRIVSVPVGRARGAP